MTVATKNSPVPATPGKPGVYEVARPGNHCSACGRELPPGTKIMAALRETDQGFDRVDLDLDCWPSFERANLLAFWQSVVRQPTAKKQLFVDDAVLAELFERLNDVTEPAKVNFRFVLGLILMRKRLLVYESSDQQNGQELWIVRRKGSDERMPLRNPHLTESQVAEVSQQLGDILNETL